MHSQNIHDKMATMMKNQSESCDSGRIETRGTATKNTRPPKKKSKSIESTDGTRKGIGGEAIERDSGSNVVAKDGRGTHTSEENDSGSDGEVRCFCNDKREKGEMVQCEVCTGWFHLECLRMKQGVGVLDGRSFVCCFCLSVKVLELTSLVGELRGEMSELRESVKVLRKANDDLVERVMVAEGDWKKVERSGRVVEVRKKLVSATRPGGRKSESGDGAVRVGVSNSSNKKRSETSPTKLIKRNEQGVFVGARKLWGTRKSETVDTIKKRLQEKFRDAHKIEVNRVYKEDANRVRWWFWLKADEEVLCELEKVVLDEFWKVQRQSPFLGIATMRILPR